MATQVPESQLVAKNRCALYRNTDHNVAGAWAAVPFDQEDYDTNNMHDNTTNNTRITIKESGYYSFGASARWNTTVSGGLKISRFSSTGSLLRGGVMNFHGGNLNITNISKEYYLNAGDYLELYAFSSPSTTLSHSSTGEVEANLSFYCAMRSK